MFLVTIVSALACVAAVRGQAARGLGACTAADYDALTACANAEAEPATLAAGVCNALGGQIDCAARVACHAGAVRTRALADACASAQCGAACGRYISVPAADALWADVGSPEFTLPGAATQDWQILEYSDVECEVSLEISASVP